MAQETVILGKSEQQLMDEVFKLSDAGGSVIQVRTREYARTLVTLRKGILADESNRYYEWDQINGSRTFTLENCQNHQVVGDKHNDLAAKLLDPLEQLSSTTSNVRRESECLHYFIFTNAHSYISNNPYCIEAVHQLAAILPSTNACVIFVTPELALEGVTLGTILTVDAPTPSVDELEQCLRQMVTAASAEFDEKPDMEDEDYRMVAALGQGMSRFEYETYASISIVEAAQRNEGPVCVQDFIEGIGRGKTEVVKQSDILELFHTEDMGDVGGMQRLKDWITARSDSFTEEAKAFGVQAPKGIAIVGVPGTGKSLVAKAIASVMRVPLIRLDFGAVFSKFIGDSESRMRSALRMIDGMDRLVLFADEIDKGLGGIGQGGGDSGTSSRVLGAFLTWMQETKSEVFVIVTANRIEGLPPELFRKGRLDQVFSVGLPTREERLEVLGVHLRKRNRSIQDYTKAELDGFALASEGYVPAEIEAAVKDGLILAFNDKSAEDLEMHHIITALKDSVAMSVSHREQINKILDWARDNATPVNYENRERESDDNDPAGSARTPRRARRTVG